MNEIVKLQAMSLLNYLSYYCISYSDIPRDILMFEILYLTYFVVKTFLH